MANEWPTLSLDEANVRLIDCEHRTPPPSDSGYPYVAIPQLRHGRIDLTDVRRISPKHYIEWTRKAKPSEHDVVLSRRCNPGETAFVPANLEFALGQNLVLLRADGTKVYPPFLRWLVSSPEWWEQIGKFLNVGAVFDSLRCADVPKFRLHLPPLAEQQTISHVLGSADKKIGLNRKLNETLEAMAWTLFKSWFVDFDPVRAKSEGRDTGLPERIATLFPTSFEDSEIGKIPSSWTVKSLGDLVELAYGKSLKEADRRPGNIAVFGSNGLIGWHDEKLVEGPGIIVGRKGNPGIVTWVPTDFFAIDTTFYVVPKAECESYHFLFYALKGHNLASLGADSAVPGLNRNMAYISKQLVPPTSLLSEFDQQVRPLFERIQRGKEESSSLAQMRDALLPKLISGELRVTSFERFIGEAVR
jgi:type I restriction enzyme S subunit